MLIEHDVNLLFECKLNRPPQDYNVNEFMHVTKKLQKLSKLDGGSNDG